MSWLDSNSPVFSVFIRCSWETTRNISSLSGAAQLGSYSHLSFFPTLQEITLNHTTVQSHSMYTKSAAREPKHKCFQPYIFSFNFTILTIGEFLVEERWNIHYIWYLGSCEYELTIRKQNSWVQYTLVTSNLFHWALSNYIIMFIETCDVKIKWSWY